MTRRRMDETVAALEERLHGRHLMDEIIGFFRGGEEGSGSGVRLRESISASARSATHAVVNTVKKNSAPILLMTAGAAWLAYSATRRQRSSSEEETSIEEDRFDPDAHNDRPIEYPGGTPETIGASNEETTEAGTTKIQHMKEKFSDFSGAAREKFESLRDRASNLTGRVQDRTRMLYKEARTGVAHAVDEHPIEIGLGCLAVGMLVGLALPTPEPVERFAGPTVERWRDRTRQAGRDLVQKGSRVARAATDAAKQEVQAQGLNWSRHEQSGTAEPAKNDLPAAGDGASGTAGPTNPAATEPAT